MCVVFNQRDDVMRNSLQQFDHLPDTALVSVQTFAALLGAGVSTIWRRAKLEASFPQPVRLSTRCTRWRVADIRRFLGLEGGAV